MEEETPAPLNEQTSSNASSNTPTEDTDLMNTTELEEQLAPPSIVERVQEKNRELQKKGLCTFLLICVVVFLIVDSTYFCIIPGLLSGFLDWVEQNPTTGIFTFTIVFLLSTILLVPGAILTLGAGYVFANAFGMYKGVLLGSLSTFIGAVAGSLASFFLGRYLLRNWVSRMSAKYEKFEALNSALEAKGLRIMVLLRLSPIIPYNVVNYVAGVTGITVLEYTISLLALVPGIVLYVFLGASAGSLASSNEAGKGSTTTTIVIIASVLFGIAAIGLTSYYSKRELNKITERKRRTQISSATPSATQVFASEDLPSIDGFEVSMATEEGQVDEERERERTQAKQSNQPKKKGRRPTKNILGERNVDASTSTSDAES